MHLNGREQRGQRRPGENRKAHKKLNIKTSWEVQQPGIRKVYCENQRSREGQPNFADEEDEEGRLNRWIGTSNAQGTRKRTEQVSKASVPLHKRR